MYVCNQTQAAAARCSVSSFTVCQSFLGFQMRLHEGGSWWKQLRWAFVVFFFLVDLNLRAHVALSTAQMRRMPRFSRTPLHKTASWMFPKDSLLFEFPRAFRRKGWWISSTILLSGKVHRCAMSACRPASELASSKGGVNASPKFAPCQTFLLSKENVCVRFVHAACFPKLCAFPCELSWCFRKSI